MEPLPVMKGRLSLPAGMAGDDAYNLIMIEGLADEGGDQTLPKDPFDGRIILVEVAGNDHDRQMGICLTELPGQVETIDVRKFGVQEGHAELIALCQRNCFAGACGRPAGKTRSADDILHNPAHLGLVVHNENRGLFFVHGSPPEKRAGNVTVKTLPRPSTLSASMVPRCCLTME